MRDADLRMEGRDAAVHIMWVFMQSRGVVAAAANAPDTIPIAKSSCGDDRKILEQILRYLASFESFVSEILLGYPASCQHHADSLVHTMAPSLFTSSNAIAGPVPLACSL